MVEMTDVRYQSQSMESDYSAFYRGIGEKRISDSSRYIAAVAALDQVPDSKAVEQEIMEARTCFISSFPILL